MANIILKKLLKKLNSNFTENIENRKFLDKAFWITLKLKMNLRVLLKKNGKTFKQRQMNQVKNCITYIGTTHTEHRADRDQPKELMYTFMQEWLEKLTMVWKFKSSFRSHFKRTQSIEDIESKM